MRKNAQAVKKEKKLAYPVTIWPTPRQKILVTRLSTASIQYQYHFVDELFIASTSQRLLHSTYKQTII